MRPAAQEITRENLTMAHFDPLLERNKHFATTNAREGASIVAKHPVYVITCLDPRTDPSAFLELRLGDAIVVRNAGGRVSPDVLTDLAYIGYLSAKVNPAGAAVRGRRDPPHRLRYALPGRRGFPPRVRWPDRG